MYIEFALAVVSPVTNNVTLFKLVDEPEIAARPVFTVVLAVTAGDDMTTVSTLLAATESKATA